jgi:hypothetical protein
MRARACAAALSRASLRIRVYIALGAFLHGFLICPVGVFSVASRLAPTRLAATPWPSFPGGHEAVGSAECGGRLRYTDRKVLLSEAVVATTGRAVTAAYSGSSGLATRNVSRCSYCNYAHHKDLREAAFENSKSATLSVELRAQVHV